MGKRTKHTKNTKKTTKETQISKKTKTDKNSKPTKVDQEELQDLDIFNDLLQFEKDQISQKLSRIFKEDLKQNQTLIKKKFFLLLLKAFGLAEYQSNEILEEFQNFDINEFIEILNENLVLFDNIDVPLYSKNKEFDKFKQNMEHFFQVLICQLEVIIFDTDILVDLLSWLEKFSSCHFKILRNCSLHLCQYLMKFFFELQENKAKEEQILQQLTQQDQQLSQNKQKLVESLLDKIFYEILEERVNDIRYDIRQKALEIMIDSSQKNQKYLRNRDYIEVLKLKLFDDRLDIKLLALKQISSLFQNQQEDDQFLVKAFDKDFILIFYSLLCSGSNKKIIKEVGCILSGIFKSFPSLIEPDIRSKIFKLIFCQFSDVQKEIAFLIVQYKFQNLNHNLNQENPNSLQDLNEFCSFFLDLIPNLNESPGYFKILAESLSKQTEIIYDINSMTSVLTNMENSANQNSLFTKDHKFFLLNLINGVQQYFSEKTNLKNDSSLLKHFENFNYGLVENMQSIFEIYSQNEEFLQKILVIYSKMSLESIREIVKWESLQTVIQIADKIFGHAKNKEIIKLIVQVLNVLKNQGNIQTNQHINQLLLKLVQEWLQVFFTLPIQILDNSKSSEEKFQVLVPCLQKLIQIIPFSSQSDFSISSITSQLQQFYVHFLQQGDIHIEFIRSYHSLHFIIFVSQMNHLFNVQNLQVSILKEYNSIQNSCFEVFSEAINFHKAVEKYEKTIKIENLQQKTTLIQESGFISLCDLLYFISNDNLNQIKHIYYIPQKRLLEEMQAYLQGLLETIYSIEQEEKKKEFFLEFLLNPLKSYLRLLKQSSGFFHTHFTYQLFLGIFEFLRFQEFQILFQDTCKSIQNKDFKNNIEQKLGFLKMIQQNLNQLVVEDKNIGKAERFAQEMSRIYCSNVDKQYLSNYQDQLQKFIVICVVQGLQSQESLPMCGIVNHFLSKNVLTKDQLKKIYSFVLKNQNDVKEKNSDIFQHPHHKYIIQLNKNLEKLTNLKYVEKEQLDSKKKSSQNLEEIEEGKEEEEENEDNSQESSGNSKKKPRVKNSLQKMIGKAGTKSNQKPNPIENSLNKKRSIKRRNQNPVNQKQDSKGAGSKEPSVFQKKPSSIKKPKY